MLRLFRLPISTPLLLGLAVLLLLSSCGKRLPPPQAPTSSAPLPAPPPAAAEPSVAALAPELNVRIEPDVIQAGESASLSWEAQRAATVEIDHQIGVVETSGRVKIFPDQTSTYRVTAQGPGGTTSREVTVQVSQQGTGTIQEEDLTGKTEEERLAYFVKPVFFDYDSSELTDPAKLTLDGNIQWLLELENLNVRILLEGHADERGTEEYNLALGDKRAQVVKDYLVKHGVDPNRLATVSLGEERPFDPRHTEEAYNFNRRVHFLLSPGAKRP